MTTKIDQLIADLPDDLQPLARQYADLTVESLAAQLTAIADLLIDNKQGQAFRLAVSGLSTTDLLLVWDSINTRLTELADPRPALAVGMRMFLSLALNYPGQP